MSSSNRIVTDEQVEAIKELAAITARRPQIEESLFLERYLPVLAGQVSDVSPAVWLEVASSATAEVEVVKDGEVLFVVPPLLKEAGIKENHDPANTINEILQTAELKSKQHPRLGIAYLDEALENKIIDQSTHTELLAQWNGILSSYGYETIAEDKIGNTTPTANTGKTEVEVDGYDEL